jgi:hypothetical protein
MCVTGVVWCGVVWCGVVSGTCHDVMTCMQASQSQVLGNTVSRWHDYASATPTRRASAGGGGGGISDAGSDAAAVGRLAMTMSPIEALHAVVHRLDRSFNTEGDPEAHANGAASHENENGRVAAFPLSETVTRELAGAGDATVTGDGHGGRADMVIASHIDD